MELSDRLHESLYNLRVSSEIMLRAITLSMPKNLNYLIVDFVRPSEIKPRDISLYIADNDVHIDDKAKPHLQIAFDINQSVFIDTKPEPKPSSMASQSFFSEY